MTDGIAKIRIKLGSLDVEYEGKESFLEKGLIGLMEHLATFAEKHKETIPDAQENPRQKKTHTHQPDGKLASTSSVAANLDVKSGSDLVIAAATYLAVGEGKAKFSRQEILSEMKGATSFYKANMNGNLTKILNSLVKNKSLNSIGGSDYALSAAKKKAMEEALA